MLIRKIVAAVLAASLVLPVLPAGGGEAAWNGRTAQVRAAASKKEVVLERDVAGNPIIRTDPEGNRFYGGDPSILVDGDTVYAYSGHDVSTDSEVKRKVYNIPEYCCYSTKDLKTWKWEGSVMQVSKENVSWVNDSSSAWASQVTKYRGNYYLYFCSWDKTSSGKQSIGVAVSDSPTGPFKDIGKPLVKGTITEPQSSNWDDIDPTVWIETDSSGVEHRYLAWGNTRFYVCELNEDMISVKDINGDGKITCGTSSKEADIINKTPSGFTEAPWIYRRSNDEGGYVGPYYLFYASGWHERMAYSTTDDLMDGTWTYGKILMPPTATSNTNHMAVFDFQGKTYFMYHNGSQPGGNGYRRIPCLTELHFNKDGSIQEIPETASGPSGTISVFYTNSGALLEHEYFVNSGSESSYPYLNQKIGVGIGKEEADHEWLIMDGKSPAGTDASKGAYISIQSENKPGLYITARSKSKAALSQDADASGDTAKKQTFHTVQGLSNEKGVSFESVAFPGYYLTMVNGSLNMSDGSDTEAATFYLDTDKGDSSLRSIAATAKNNQILQGTKSTGTIAKNITLTVSYANGTTKKAANFTMDVSKLNVKKVGTQTISVIYTEGKVTKKTTLPIEVVIKPLAVKKLTVKTKVKKKKVSVTLRWTKTAGQNYELSYGKKKSKHTKLGTPDIAKKTKTYTRSLKKLARGKKYYFHIRTYSKVNGKKKYSKYKTVRKKIK